MINTVLFDMDGVLVDSEVFYLVRLVDFFREHHQHAPIDELKKTCGMSMDLFWRTLADLWDTDIEPETIKAMFPIEGENDYNDLKNPHVHYLLKHLKARGLTVGIASASEQVEIDAMMEQTGITTWIDYTLSGADLPHSKPDPLIYRTAMQALHTTPEQTIIIEDSQVGIQAAKAAGAYVIAKREERFPIDQSAADAIADDLMDVWLKIEELL